QNQGTDARRQTTQNQGKPASRREEAPGARRPATGRALPAVGRRSPPAARPVAAPVPARGRGPPGWLTRSAAVCRALGARLGADAGFPCPRVLIRRASFP